MVKGLPALLGAFLIGLVVPAMASAQPVPLPNPAPQPKTNSTDMAPPAPVAEARGPAAGLGSIFNRAKAGETTAFDANQRALVDKISNYLTGIRTLVGDFVQVGPDGSKTEGQIYLQKPGRVRFEYAPPSPIELVADGQSLVVRDRKLATQDLYPLGQTPLRFLLADRVDLLRDTNVVGVYSDNIFTTVVIEEKKTLGGTHKLMLMFGAQDLALKQWTVTDPQGYDTTVAIYNLDMTKRPDPGLFKINYERIQNPAN
ncbi:MAG: outer-membrane lipoprotein carrier protein LolA [Pseudorhodoplanes sp.]|jgi:outer membrane lipoprotein-sorting protein|nr:outer-membrane lipoprotein carrier protein LolA [Pseudorhodoplanes sp.]